MHLIKKLLLALFILECLNSFLIEEIKPLKDIRSLQQEYFPNGKKLRGCINPEYRNSPEGYTICANYTDDTNNTVNLDDSSCELQYWHCCQDSWKNDDGSLETGIKTCTSINKCSTYYKVKTCVTPPVCQKMCMFIGRTFDFFENSSNLDSASNNIKDLISKQNKDEAFINIAQKDWVRSSQCVGESINITQGKETNCCTECETQFYTLY